MAEAFPVTIRLALLALLFEGVLGIGAGLIAGLRRGGIFDATLLLLSLVVIAVPIFVIGFVVQIVFGVKLGWINPTVGPEATWGELVVPASCSARSRSPTSLRLTRDSITENLSADWVRTATAKGLSRRRVVTTHVLRNSLIPVVTFLGADLGALMAGAIVTEGIFNIPGVGHALYQAIVRGEGPTVVSIVTVLVLIYIVDQPARRPALRRPGPEDPLCLRPLCGPTPSSPGPLRRRSRGDALWRPPTRSTSRPRPAASGWRPGARCATARCSSSRR